VTSVFLNQVKNYIAIVSN